MGRARRRVAVACLLAALAALASAGPALAAPFTVDTAADSGAGSLRQAILDSNAAAGSDTITMLTSVVALDSRLPDITGDVAIEGHPADTKVSRQSGAPEFPILTIGSGGSAQITRFEVTGGRTSTLEGAGITNLGELTLENSTVTGNVATAGGASAAAGIFSTGPLALDTVRIVANTSLGDGGHGAINAAAGGLTMERTTIAGNSGEVGILGAGAATISDSTISANTTAGDVVGMVSGSIANSTISGNASNFAFVTGLGSTTLRSVTVAGNDVESGVPILAANGATLTVQNSLVADNAGSGPNFVAFPGIPPFVPAGTIVSGGHNLSDRSDPELDQPTDLKGTDPQLRLLGNNGGPTRTHALPPTSPAIDAGFSDGLSTDQRGQPRPVQQPHIPDASGGDGADIGAYELVLDPSIPPGCQIVGTSGNDVLTGTGASETICGLGGNDRLTGAGGSDTLIGGGGGDRLIGGDGGDNLQGGDGGDVLDGGAEADTLSGGSATADLVTYESRSAQIVATIGIGGNGEAGEGDVIAADVERLRGGSAGDQLTGSTGRNRLLGGPGNDTLSGGGADDALFGEAGEDALFGEAGGTDVLDGGAGPDSFSGGDGTSDLVTYEARETAVIASIGDGADDGAPGEGDDVATDVERLLGGDAADTLTGDADRNRLMGGEGADEITGGAGSDSLRGEAGDDTIDALDGAPFSDQLLCGAGTDTALADPGDNVAADCE